MEKRIKKWLAKLNGEKRKQIIDRQKTIMIRLEKEATEKLVRIEKEVKQLAKNEPLLLIPYYIIFAKELNKLINKHSSQTLINEAVILEAKWETRGLNNLIVNKIKEFYIQSYKTHQLFRLDTSLLDGPDILA